MKYAFLAIGLLTLSACSPNPADHVTPTVAVESASGPVTCQLYRRDMVMWDHAVARPTGMSNDAANDICRAEGQRQKDGTPAQTATETAPAV